jgi:hypothetical protein
MRKSVQGRRRPAGNSSHFCNGIVIPTEAHPDFLLRGTHQQSRVRLSVGESRMKFDYATNFDRKSGGAEWRDLLFPFPANRSFL